MQARPPCMCLRIASEKESTLIVYVARGGNRLDYSGGGATLRVILASCGFCGVRILCVLELLVFAQAKTRPSALRRKATLPSRWRRQEHPPLYLALAVTYVLSGCLWLLDYLNCRGLPDAQWPRGSRKPQ